jgi:hypothetical protein
MDFIIYGLFFVVGVLVTYVLLPSGPGPFERLIWAGLKQNKRVIMSIDNKAYIFQLYGNRLRISEGKTEYMEDEYAGIMADDLDNVSDPESVDSSSNDLPNGQS